MYSRLEEAGVIELTSDMYEFIPAENVTYAIEKSNGVSYDFADRLTYEDGKLTVTVVKEGGAKVEVEISGLSLSHSFSGGDMSVALGGDWKLSLGSEEDSPGETPLIEKDDPFDVQLGELRIHGVGKVALSITVRHSIKFGFSGSFSIGVNTAEEGFDTISKSFSVTKEL